MGCLLFAWGREVGGGGLGMDAVRCSGAPLMCLESRRGEVACLDGGLIDTIEMGMRSDVLILLG